MDLQFVVLADSAALRERGKMDLFGAGVEAIFTRAVPALHAALSVAIRLRLTADEAAQAHRFEVQLSSPEGEQVAGVVGDLAAPDQAVLDSLPEGSLAALPLVVPLVNIPLPSFGTYRLSLLWDGEPLCEPVPLIVAETPPEMPQ